MFGLSRYRTARCVLRCEDEVLLAVHSSFWARSDRRWGLPGGNIEWREHPQDAVARELAEELELELDDFVEIGAYRYKGADHMVFGADIPTRVEQYDRSELLDIGWFGLAGVEELEAAHKLHAGYELRAVQAYLQKLENN